MIAGTIKQRKKKMMRICKSCGEVIEIFDIVCSCDKYLKGHFCVECGIDPYMEFLSACEEIKEEVLR